MSLFGNVSSNSPAGVSVETAKTDGTCNQVVTLKAGQSDLSVQVIEKGLHVFSISFNDKNGKKQEIIIGPEDPKDQVKDRRVSSGHEAVFPPFDKEVNN
jgi:hypothetical protein